MRAAASAALMPIMMPLLMLSALSSLSAGAHAEQSDDAALQLADGVPDAAPAAAGWQGFVELAGGRSAGRSGNTNGERLSLDFRLDRTLGSGWRAVFADRLDATWSQPGGRNEINTLKEAYLSWQPAEQAVADLGRINARYGVATGYNPTDYFRRGAVRSVVSVDPASLKINRQGSAMLRGQTLWTGGSATAIYSPRLASTPSDAPFSPDWGSTNDKERWLLAFSQNLARGISPQWLLYKEQGVPTQLGMNITALVSDSAVAYAEWSGGRSPSQLSQAMQAMGMRVVADDTAFRNRLSAGLTYTFGNKLSVTGEYQYDGAALGSAGWDALRRAPAAYLTYRLWAQSAQEPATRHGLFLYATWQDAMVDHFDMTAMVRFNSEDSSRLNWIEGRYRWTRDELALQWQVNSGTPASEFGFAPQRRAWQVVYRHFPLW